jgi:hypothetical protein
VTWTNDGESDHASITVDDLLGLPAPVARRGLTRGLDAATALRQAGGGASWSP